MRRLSSSDMCKLSQQRNETLQFNNRMEEESSSIFFPNVRQTIDCKHKSIVLSSNKQDKRFGDEMKLSFLTATVGLWDAVAK